MGKYIKYFEDENAFAEWLNFGEKEEGPDGAPSTFVAYVGENDTLYYEHSDVSGYELLFEPQNSEIDATAETVTFAIKTGSFWLDVYHNGEFVQTYRPALNEGVRFEVDANMTPLSVDELFTGMWYKDNNGEKGEYIQNWDRSVTHKPDPYADPVNMMLTAGFTTDGQNPTVLGNALLSGATRILLVSDPDPIDIKREVYEENGNLMYHFSAESETDIEVRFEFERENLTIFQPYFQNSDATWIEISTNYPKLGGRTGFLIVSPIMNNSTISDVNLYEGIQAVLPGAFLGANVNYIYIEGDVLPAVSGQFSGLQANGTFEVDSRDAVNFQNWVNALPSGWEILPEPGPSGPAVTVVGTFITTTDGETVNVPSYDGGNWSYAYIDGDESNILPIGDTSYTFATAGEHTIIYVRESDDTYLQDWFNATDAVSVDASGSTTWGCHGNDYYQSTTSMVFANNTQLTGATFDENCDRIGSSCFSGCTALVYLAFNNPSGVSLNGDVYPFDTITANQGELHIPSGSQSAYADLITALGNNWSVQDDL